MQDEEIIQLYNEYQSIRKISRESGIYRGKVTRILRKNNIKILENKLATKRSNLKHLKTKFNGNNKEKAYLFGFVYGDVHVYQRSEFTLRAITHTTHGAFIDLFFDLFKEYGHVHCRYKEKTNEWVLMIDLDYSSFKFLEERKKESIPKWITKDIFYSFLAGFIDSDGSAYIKRAKDRIQYSIRFFGQERGLLNEIWFKLRDDGFNANLYKSFKKGNKRTYKNRIIIYNRDYYTVEISNRKDCINLLKKLNLRHKEKILRKVQMMYLYNQKRFSWKEVKDEVLRLRWIVKNMPHNLSNLSH